MAVNKSVPIPLTAFVKGQSQNLVNTQTAPTLSIEKNILEYPHRIYADLVRSENSTRLAALTVKSAVPGKFLSSSFVLMGAPTKRDIRDNASNFGPSKLIAAKFGSERKTAETKRLSGYFWVFARPDDDGSSSGGFAAPGQIADSQFGTQYGGSQLGAILTYRLTGQSDRGATVFGRVTSAIHSSGQEEAALGVRIKPASTIPVALYAEHRLGFANGDNRGTAAYLAGGFGPQEIAGGVQLETYGQAGYRFGPAASYFFDGSATLQKNILAGSGTRISVGGGLWTGGQKGTSRLDVGPRASFDLPIGGSRARVFVDWRQRIDGDAAPDSGLALTLTTGF